MERLLEAPHGHFVQMLYALEPSYKLYIEFCDNIEVSMTSLRFYAEHGLPAY